MRMKPSAGIIMCMLIVTVVAGVSSLVSENSASAQTKCRSKSGVGPYIFNPSDLTAMKQAAELIVTATVTGVVPDKDIATPLSSIPTQHIFLHVIKKYKGEVKQPSKGVTTRTDDTADDLVLFRLGDPECNTDDQPPYKTGETVVVFLVERKDQQGIYRLVALEGRYQVENGTLIPMKNTGFNKEWKGRPLEELERKLETP